MDAHQPGQSSVALYLAFQSVVVTGWWAWLALSPPCIPLFRSHSTPDGVLVDFWLADLLLVAGGSALASVLVWRRSACQIPMLWFLSGSLLYATLYSVGATLRSGGGWLAVALMTPASVMTCLAATWMTRR